MQQLCTAKLECRKASEEIKAEVTKLFLAKLFALNTSGQIIHKITVLLLFFSQQKFN